MRDYTSTILTVLRIDSDSDQFMLQSLFVLLDATAYGKAISRIVQASCQIMLNLGYHERMTVSVERTSILEAQSQGKNMNLKNECIVVVGALIGGLVGFVAFKWLLGQGFYGLLLPGGLLGMGAGMLKTPTNIIAVVCGILALAFGLVAEWSAFPFSADESLAYFLMHFYDLKPITLIMIVLGGAIGFYIPFRRGERSSASTVN